MNEFEDLKTAWESQEGQAPASSSNAIIEKAEKLSKKLKSGRRWTVIILSITVLGLIAFALYYEVYHNIQPSVGIGMMIFGLLLRIFIELRDIKRFDAIDIHASFKDHGKQLLKYHRQRKVVHFVWTPIIVLLYAFGFYLMLPSFKATLSEGFYTYILISAIVLLIGYSYIFYREAKKELNTISVLSALN